MKPDFLTGKNLDYDYSLKSKLLNLLFLDVINYLLSSKS